MATRDEPSERINRLSGKNVFSVSINIKGEDKTMAFSGDEISDGSSSNQLIHLDDSILEVKRKIVLAINSESIMAEEMYLFCFREIFVTSAEVYQHLTQFGKVPLSGEILASFMTNVAGVSSDIVRKRIYDYQDVVELGLDRRKIKIMSTLGDGDVLPGIGFVVDPLNALRQMKGSVKDVNGSLLLASGEIVGNMIHVRLAEDVLSESAVSDTAMIDCYYPYLREMDVASLVDLKQHQKLRHIEHPKELKGVHLMYEVFNERTSPIRYLEWGTSAIKFRIDPQYPMKLPLDIIFKLIHTTDLMPFVKMNPSRKKEGMYRLYTDRVAADGRKIPVLSKAMILKAGRLTGRQKSIIAYFSNVSPFVRLLTCEFRDDGSVTSVLEFAKPATLEQLAEVIRTFVNPLVDTMTRLIEQSGHKLPKFSTFEDTRLKVINSTFNVVTDARSAIDITSIGGCLRGSFIVESNDFYKGIEMRFHRVNNFDINKSQSSFVTENLKAAMPVRNIIDGLVVSYRMTRQDASELVGRIEADVNTKSFAAIRDVNVGGMGGFKTTIGFNSVNGQISVQVTGINDIKYLETIPIYVDTLLRITQSPETTRVPAAVIKRVCATHEVQENPRLQEEKEESPIFKPPVQIISSAKPQGKNLAAMLEDSSSSGSTRASSQSGGAPTPAQNLINIDNLKLNNPTPFFTKMLAADPVLFLTQDQGKFRRYSRLCSSSAKKHPVVLNKDEYEAFRADELQVAQGKYDDIHGAGSFQRLSKKEASDYLEDNSFVKENDVLKYGSDPSKENYYMCPRYWCLKTNKPINPNELIKDPITGELSHPTCGGVISPGDKKVPKGKYIYEFNASKPGTAFTKHYPGFLGHGKHPKGLCVPCCFTNYKPGIRDASKCNKGDNDKNREGDKGDEDKEGAENEEDDQNGQNGQNGQNEENEEDDGGVKEPRGKNRTLKVIAEKDKYFLGPEMSPLEEGRWGAMSIAMQHFFKESSLDYQVSRTNTKIKQGIPCLLRHGVQFSDTQSFIACISDCLFYGESRVLTIKEMKTRIIKAITLDSYITFQNGDNVIAFLDKDNLDKVNVTKYSTTQLYVKIFEKPNVDYLEESYFRNAVASFENFLSFLNDDETSIDYVYLWDLVCTPNKLLFPRGINLVILEALNHDPTNAIDLVCPTNHYSGETYDPKKGTLFLVKTGATFEPIYSYESNPKSIKVEKTFSEYNALLSATMRSIFHNIIKPAMEDSCKAFSSIPDTNVYKYKHAILIGALIKALRKYRVTILHQIVNYQGKVIALFCEVISTKARGIVPCYPANLHKNYPYLFMNDETVYQDYESTVAFLNWLSVKTKGAVPCKPAFSVVDDELIVGVLTETNQFIQLRSPAMLVDKYDDIPLLRDTNYVIKDGEDGDEIRAIDGEIETGATKDTERSEYIRRIKLETSMYNAFRNTIRGKLNDYQYVQERSEILEVLNDQSYMYTTKLGEVERLLRDLTGEAVGFVEGLDTGDLENIAPCSNMEGKKCSGGCAQVAGECQLLIPATNLLLDDVDNESMYYGKVADELIRYSRIRLYMMEPQSYLAFGNLRYDLLEDEIILMDSMIDDYFIDLVPVTSNPYVKFNTYDNAMPAQSVEYERILNVPVEEGLERTTTWKEGISSQQWSKCFPDGYGENVYESTPMGGFFVAIDIIKAFTGTVLTIAQLKSNLYEGYERYMGAYEKKIINVAIREGKRVLGGLLTEEKITFQEAIQTAHYYITNMDLWILLDLYKIPSVLLCNRPILQTNYNSNILVAYGSVEEDCVYILTPAMANEKSPTYKVISSQEKGMFASFDILRGECAGNVAEVFPSKITIDSFLSGLTKTLRKPTRMAGRIINLLEDDDDIADEAIPEPIGEEDRPPFEIVAREARDCGPGKKLNPVTNRCVKVKGPRPCPPGKEVNVVTNRCKTIKGSKIKRNAPALALAPDPAQNAREQVEEQDKEQVDGQRQEEKDEEEKDEEEKDEEEKDERQEKGQEEKGEERERELPDRQPFEVVCPPGREYNPATKRCRKIGTNRTRKVHDCPEGKVMNPETNRCVKVKNNS